MQRLFKLASLSSCQIEEKIIVGGSPKGCPTQIVQKIFFLHLDRKFTLATFAMRINSPSCALEHPVFRTALYPTL
jgi:hypothetical protein